jgi:hypothetical protein
MIKYLTSKSTAAGDTVKTLVDTLVLPANTKAIVGAWVYAVGGPGLTTLENVTGILTLESEDVNLGPMDIPLEPAGMLTGGGVSLANKVWPLNVPVSGPYRIKGSITMDMAQTVANTCRFGLVIDVG